MNAEDNNYIEGFLKEDTSHSYTNVIHELFVSYSRTDMRKSFQTGVRVGFEQGIYKSKPENRILQLENICKNNNDKEFYDKFMKLCQEYNIRIEYHPEEGMIFTNLNE